MNYIIRRLNYINGVPKSITHIEPSEILLTEKALLSIDGSSTCSGLSLIDCDGTLRYSIALLRGTEISETPIQYKVAFKRFIDKVFGVNSSITSVYYEEPFIEFIDASKVLMSLRTSVEEIIAERAPLYDYISFIETANTKWKTQFLYPEALPPHTAEQKRAVTKKVCELYPLLAEDGVTEDECDSIGLGLVAAGHTKTNTQESLKSKKTVKAFQYNAKFIGASDDDEMLQELGELIHEFKIPSKLIESFLEDPDIIELTGKGLFNNHVYQAIGNEDRMVIFSFKSGKYAPLLLEHRVTHLTLGNPTIYAVIWRKTRKK